MTYEQFAKEFDEWMAKTSDEELMAALRHAGCKFKGDPISNADLVEYDSPAGPYWYHPDHPLCQDGKVLWEFPGGEE